MQAFKAANPHAVLEDFVRWHSPKDWVEKSHGNGSLSARMSEPTNIWQELWKVKQRHHRTTLTLLFAWKVCTKDPGLTTTLAIQSQFGR